MKWFWFSVCMMWVFLPFGMMQEGSIGLCVVGSLAVLNALKEHTKPKINHVNSDILEEFK